jgi:hypothetical protein
MTGVRDEGHGYLRKGRLPDLQRLPEKRDGEAAAVARAVAGTRQGARPQLGQPRPGTRHYRSDGKTTPRTRILFSTNVSKTGQILFVKKKETSTIFLLGI